MVWTKENIGSSVNQGAVFIADYLAKQRIPDFSEKSVFRVAIIGGGPKGFYALESLLRKIDSEKSDEPIEIYWFNSASNFGSGPNFDPLQPDYLLINTCIGPVDAWCRDRNKLSDEKFPDLVQWLKKVNSSLVPVRTSDYASRALVGCYLQEMTAAVIKSKPSHVNLFLIIDSVQGIQQDEGFKLRLSSGDFRFTMDNVLLTTGHCYSNSSLIKEQGTDSLLLKKTYLTEVWTGDQLNLIDPASKVGIAGMGLTFIDIALHLSEGRGGSFNYSGKYIPSGNEPTIYPFSRTGQPILPRSASFTHFKYKLRFITNDWLQELHQHALNRKVDFFEEILPVLEKEVAFAYYSTLIGSDDHHAVALYISDLEAEEKFDLQRLLFGIVSDGKSRHESILDFMDYAVEEADQGELGSPLISAMSVWRQAVPLIGEIYANGGLTGQSQQKLDRSLLGALNRTSFGPPVENMRKILALAKAGIIRFDLGEQVEVRNSDMDKYLLTSSKFEQEVDYLIDARVARPQLENDNSPLYRQLLEDNLIEPYSNQGYQPGCVSMDPKGQTTVNSPNMPALFFYGSNTEGVLLDNDSLSRTRNNLAKHWAEFTLNQFVKTKYTQNELSF